MSDPMLTIYQAMAKILADVDHIGKDRKADMGNAGKYNFRGIDDVLNTLHSSFAKYKVFIIPEIIDSKIEVQEKEKTYNGVVNKSYTYSAILTVKFTFVSEDGSSISAVGIGHALDQSDKSTNKAQSSALKYCLMQTFLIPTEESKDVEAENIQVAPKSTVAPSKQSNPAIEESRQATRECFEILGWKKDRVMEWSKKINQAPFDNWTLENWRTANTKALMEIDKLNAVDEGHYDTSYPPEIENQ
jgi:ERF superfamily